MTSSPETLPPDHELVQLNVRVPQFLLPMLAERGFECDIDESHTDRVLVRIRRTRGPINHSTSQESIVS